MIATLLLLLACSGKQTVECSEKTACDFGSTCVKGKCQEQLCATSDQCGIEQYCTSDHNCTSGCEADSDCKFGDVCDVDSNTCVPKKCGSGRVDCSFGQFCNINGECYDAAGYYCRECNDDFACGGNGNLCIGGYCGVTCEHDSDCPNGYNCLAFTDLNGNVVAHQCYTLCDQHQE